MIDAETYAQVQQLFAHYCHRADSNDAEGWASLFCEDGGFEVTGMVSLVGRTQLRTMPGIVAKQGGGKWRHQITNIDCNAAPDAGWLRITAYGLVTDWSNGGKPTNFTDYDIELRLENDAWRIARLVAHQV